MRGTSIALAAVLLGAAGGMAFGQPPAQPNGAKLTTQTTGNPAATPTINPYTPHNQNPLVNPNAAGTQMGWTGTSIDGVPHWVPPALIDPEQKPLRKPHPLENDHAQPEDP